MINGKFKKLGEQRSVIRELFEYGIKRKKEIGEDNVYDFSLGNPSIAPPKELCEAISKLSAESDPIALHGYTSAAGDPSVRAAIAKYITDTFGFYTEAGDLYMTAGAAAALTCVLTAVVTTGEEVIVLAPYFPEYKVFIERCGGVICEVKSNSASFQPDIQALRSAINEKTAAIIINSPNNPTGVVIKEENIKAMCELLDDKQKELGRPIYLISDEPYRELVYDGVSVPFLPSYYDNTIVCYSYSKSLSVPGERIGYVQVGHRCESRDEVYAAVCGAGRALGFVCAPSLMQKALPLCLGKTADIEEYDRNRRLLVSELTSYGYTVVNPEGAFYLFVKAPTDTADEFSEMAKKNEILIVPSDSFGYPGYARISYCVKTEKIEKALPAFRKLAQDVGILK